MKNPQSPRLTDALAPDVDSDVRRRGALYFRHRRIYEAKASPERFDAEVRGKGGNYRVSIEMMRDDERKRAVVSGVCACPFFSGGRGYCKHIWAALCFADGMRNCAFKAPPELQLSLRPVEITKPRVRPVVVSVEPDATGRIRGFSSVHRTASAPEMKQGKRRNTRSDKNLVSWREALKVVGHAQRDLADARQQTMAANDVHYVLDVGATTKTGQLTVQIFRATPALEDATRQLVAAPVDPEALENMVASPDREILGKFFGIVASSLVRAGQWNEGVDPLRVRSNSFTVAEELRPSLLEAMAATGRFGWMELEDAKLEGNGPFPAESFRPFAWDAEQAWAFAIAVNVIRQGQAWALRGEFRRGGSTVPLTDALATFADGFLLLEDRITRFETFSARDYGWIAALKQVETIEVTKAEQAAFLRTFAGMASAPPIGLPQSSGWKMVEGEPKPRLTFLSMPTADMPTVLTANYDFVYETPTDAGAEAQGRQASRRGRGRRGGVASRQDASRVDAAPVSQTRIVARRNREREDALVKDLCNHPGVQRSAGRATAGADVFVDATSLADLVSDLNERGWTVEAEGQKLRVGRSFQVDVTSSSGMDWLDLRALFDFGEGAAAQLPRILETVRRGGDRVVLADGSVGLLPPAWRDKLEPILRMGESVGTDASCLRYQASQAAFLDVLVSEAAEAYLDKPFAAFREKLSAFSGVGQAEPAKGFVGELRPYQRQGLGWLEFLDEFALGGCLADEMGLGKTVQVLAHLHKRGGGKTTRKRREKLPPNLIVAPTSLIHNWVDEAARFVPDLKVYAHLGASRHRDVEEFEAYDLIVTSYGTMRSDIQLLAATNFDVVVLDEAQAIKNESTQVAQAARMLKAQRRLAMSGTPVENRLSELGSLFRFLNPGLLESSAGFAKLFGSEKLAQAQLETLAKMLKPFLLRRTKEQVLPDLPSKTESTVYCVLEDEQRKQYEELAQFYRDSIKKKIKSQGLSKSRMHVLEALLRLRQLACHPGLIDPGRIEEPSAKLDLLEEQLADVMASGRKALVFSQFTSMLSIVRSRLDAKGIVYEYLDGATTDRKERVEHFQNDDSVRVFLISLKAGGVGLNLTAADYCFILDPWWNPAAEAQAIDRMHRIGQKNHVFAYRLIARGTVEEKILALQDSKRKLAEGIIADDGDVLSGMTAKDLDFLLE